MRRAKGEAIPRRRLGVILADHGEVGLVMVATERRDLIRELAGPSAPRCRACDGRGSFGSGLELRRCDPCDATGLEARFVEVAP